MTGRPDGLHTGPPLLPVATPDAWAARHAPPPPAVCGRTDPGCLAGPHGHPRRGGPAFPILDQGRVREQAAPPPAAARPRTVPVEPSKKAKQRARDQAAEAGGPPTRFAVRAWLLAEGELPARLGRLAQRHVDMWNAAHPGRPFSENGAGPAPRVDDEKERAW